MADSVLQKVALSLQSIADKKIAIGVSGGRDSMCLLHAVLSCEIFDKANIIAVHVNHCLRKAADSDEKFVERYCSAAGVPFKAFRVDVPAYAKTRSLTIEQAARELRYSAFRGVIDSGAADYVLTAHHALDNAESVLMHLFRGSGLDGLCGMREMSGHIVRPMLNVYPDELDEYAATHDIKFVVDDTNFIDDADRNYIRLNVLPIIKSRYAGAVRAINAAACDAIAAKTVLDGMLDDRYIKYDSGSVTVLDAALESPLASRYIKRALEYFSTTDVTRDMIDRAVRLASMRTGAIVQMNNGVVAAREYKGVTLYVPRLPCDREIPIALGANCIDGLAVDITPSSDPPSTVRGGAVDLDKLDGATLRFRRDGDYFTPFGGGRKMLKQYFTDNKITKRERARIPLICRGSEVLVVVGMQVSEQVKQTENTARRGVVRLRNEND